jgi:hypothetical protein
VYTSSCNNYLFSTDNLQKDTAVFIKKIHQMQAIPNLKDFYSHNFIFNLNTAKHGRRPAERSTPSRDRFTPANRRFHPLMVDLHPQDRRVHQALKIYPSGQDLRAPSTNTLPTDVHPQLVRTPTISLVRLKDLPSRSRLQSTLN